ncbi:hypothetical protein K470DRAFT_113270 [Piedraia hortae CBS 480.64]|uniref:Uncharacterized protein n=1 Tax=Piedraia hortae CBS 480.64 TaxID=1314780 RepID=A0A6A7BUZ0_9PEZI|nr:hypothetical protein K470DRAFT_113270 [Piedraia hortae CBS 480.64]
MHGANPGTWTYRLSIRLLALFSPICTTRVRHTTSSLAGGRSCLSALRLCNSSATEALEEEHDYTFAQTAKAALLKLINWISPITHNDATNPSTLRQYRLENGYRCPVCNDGSG